MPSLLSLAAAAACTAWVFAILPRLKGHLEPWDLEYDAAYRAVRKNDLATAEKHLRAAYPLTENSPEGRATVAAGLADVLEKAGRRDTESQ